MAVSTRRPGSMMVIANVSMFLALVVSGPIAVEAARAFFVFGDSLVDSGNNNYLVTTARADSPPYGIDFPSRRPTGRFSNGEAIGNEESPLPYLSPELRGRRLLNGANFASAGIGILNDTGFQFVNIIRMYQQLAYFQQYQQRVSRLIGIPRTQRLVRQSLVLITVGGNDFVNNYFLVPYSARSRQYSLPHYVRLLISEYKKILMRLHSLGVGRVLVTGAGPLGCAPAELARSSSSSGRCSAELQRAAALYDPQLTQMINALNRKIGKTVFIAANTNQMQIDFLTTPRRFGFITSKVACCGQGPYNGMGLCTVLSNLCRNRELYVFWDAFHPSEKANRIIVRHILTGTTKYMNPMNLSSALAL
uniref:GDSL esterase/lipase n=1 Tax=Brassica oleracea var. oleracea TaxID=109376 RepID=A0A0D3AJQ3_BRAOL